MGNSNELLLVIYTEKMKFMSECYKIYYSTLAIISSGFIIGIGFLVKADTTKEVLPVVACFTPIFTSAWFAAFLFCYWDNHTMRLNIEYIERLIGNNSQLNFYPTWFGNFLSIFESAKFREIRLVIPLFIIIGIFPSSLYVFSAAYALDSAVLSGWLRAAYILLLLILPPIVLGIHIFCVKRERIIIKKIYQKSGIEIANNEE